MSLDRVGLRLVRAAVLTAQRVSPCLAYRGAFAYLPTSLAVLINTDAQEAEPLELLARLVVACHRSDGAQRDEP